MDANDMTGWERAKLEGGPADGAWMRVTDRPSILQVTYPCQLDSSPGDMRVEALYLYRRDPRVRSEPLRYGFDGASP